MKRSELSPEDKLKEQIRLSNQKLHQLALKTKEQKHNPFSHKTVRMHPLSIANIQETSPAGFWNHYIQGTLGLVRLQYDEASDTEKPIHAKQVQQIQNIVFVSVQARSEGLKSKERGLDHESLDAFRDAAFSFNWDQSKELFMELFTTTHDIARYNMAMGK